MRPDWKRAARLGSHYRQSLCLRLRLRLGFGSHAHGNLLRWGLKRHGKYRRVTLGIRAKGRRATRRPERSTAPSGFEPKLLRTETSYNKTMNRQSEKRVVKNDPFLLALISHGGRSIIFIVYARRLAQGMLDPIIPILPTPTPTHPLTTPRAFAVW